MHSLCAGQVLFLMSIYTVSVIAVYRSIQNSRVISSPLTSNQEIRDVTATEFQSLKPSEECSWNIIFIFNWKVFVSYFVSNCKMLTPSRGCITSGCKKSRWVKQTGSERTMQIIWQPWKTTSSAVFGVKETETEWSGRVGYCQRSEYAIDFYGMTPKSIEWCWARTNRKLVIFTVSLCTHKVDRIRWHETHAD